MNSNTQEHNIEEKKCKRLPIASAAATWFIGTREERRNPPFMQVSFLSVSIFLRHTSPAEETSGEKKIRKPEGFAIEIYD
jgi:hypothetical protein